MGATTIGQFVADWLVRARGAAEWGRVLELLGPVQRPAYARALRGAIEHDSAGLVARVLGRVGADSNAMRIRALGHMAAWQAEVFLSKLGPSPYARGYVAEEVRARQRLQ